MHAVTNRCETCKACGHMKCIKTIPLLANLSELEVDAIGTGVSIKHFKRGERIFDQGQRADCLYIICSGKLKIYKFAPDGREQILYILSEGDFIGAFNLLKADEFDFSAEAIEDTDVSMLNKDAFDRVMLSNPAIMLKIMEKAYERINKVEKLVERLSGSNPEAKVASLLINLIRDFGHETPEGIVLMLSINREEMGSYAGIARETMSRKLQVFQEEGILEFRGTRNILIKSLEALTEKTLMQ